METASLKFINTFEIELTNNCNANCSFCPRNALCRNKGFMSRKTFETVVAKALELNIQTLTISGFGEPFLHPDILNYLTYANEKAPNLKVEIITNCALVTPEVIEKLKQLNIHQLVISFSGTDKASYEKQMPNLPYKKVMANLEYIAKQGGQLTEKVSIRPVITKTFDLPQYKTMKNNLLNLGFKPGNLRVVYLCANRGGHLCDPNVFDKEFLEKKGVKFLPARDILCMMFAKTLQIGWDGEILLCCCDINNEVKIGNIISTSFEEIRQKILYYRNPATKPDICLKCNAPFVYGGYKIIKKK